VARLLGCDGFVARLEPLALPEELVHGQLAADLDRRRAWYELLAG
jgi:hypothetical protein